MSPRRRALPLLAVLSLGACALPAPVVAPVPTPAPTTTPAPVVTPAPQPVAPVIAAPPHDPELVAPDAVAESLLVDVTRVDSTIRVELRYATPYNFMGEALPGYEAPRALLRREAAAALARVQSRLRAEGGGGLALKVFDAYRPVRASAAMVAWTRRVRREDLVRDGYVAEQGPHDQGLAVDVTLVEAESGRELKMGTAFDTFAPAARTDNATGEFAANRQRLRRAMEAEGFANVPAEWWHYSYAVPDPMRFDLVIR
jgi:D-alanyl-D-alanine dipeptidase